MQHNGLGRRYWIICRFFGSFRLVSSSKTSLIDGRADGISVPTRCYMYIIDFWLIYGILKNSIAIIAANIFALIMIATITIELTEFNQ